MTSQKKGVRKINFTEVEARPAPYRKIKELISATVLDADGVTLRIVDIEPYQKDRPRAPHAHASMEEVIYVLEGRGVVWSEGETIPVSEGDAVLIPAGQRHMTLNPTNERLRLACFFPHGNAADGFVNFPPVELDEDDLKLPM